MNSNPFQSAPDSIPPPEVGGPSYYNSNLSSHQQSMTNADGINIHLPPGVAPMMNDVAGGQHPDGLDSRGPPQTPGQHYDQQAMNTQYQGTPMSVPVNASEDRRKRTKVSRACDECRRKKIKCDAVEQVNGEEVTCANCQRVNAQCGFTRQPLKRGPSKGYIKELADRIHDLEQKKTVESPSQHLSAFGSPLQQLQRPSDEFLPQQSDNTFSRKRTYSNAEDGSFGGFLPVRPDQWNPVADNSRTFNNVSQSQTGNPHHSPNGLAELQVAQWKNTPEPLRGQSSSFENTGPSYPEQALDDSTTMLLYESLIHPTYPILAAASEKRRTMLDRLPNDLVDPFMDCLQTAVCSFPSVPSQHFLAQTRPATLAILTSAATSTTARPLSTNIALLQMMLFLAIGAENLFFSHPQHAGATSSWLSTASSLAYSMKLHIMDSLIDSGDPDSEANLSRRIWWALVVMSRWNSASVSLPNTIPDSACVLYPGESRILGDGGFALARLSIVLGEGMVFQTLPVRPLGSMAFGPSPYGGLFRCALDRVREEFSSTNPPPQVIMCFWIVKILVQIRLEDTQPLDLLDTVGNAFTQLTSEPTQYTSPLQPLCTALIIIALLDLKGYESTKAEADKMLEALRTSPSTPARLAAAMKELLDNRDTDVSSQKLQKLADAATATGEGREVSAHQENDADSANSTDSPFKSFQCGNYLRKQVHRGFLTAFNEDTEVRRGG